MTVVRGWSGAARLAILVALATACGSGIPTASLSPTPLQSSAPTASPTGTDGILPTPAPSPSVSSSPTGTAPPAPESNPTSVSLIQAAVSAGTLDETTGLVYRVMAMFGDEHVPEEYRGAWEEDLTALESAQDRLATLPAETQATLLPFLVRPTNPQSIWSGSPSAFTGQLAVSRLGAERQEGVAAAPPCVNGWTHEQVTPFIPAVVWGQCNSSGSVGNGYDQAKAAIAALWNPMTGFMGDPLGDQAPFGQSASPEEGDGMIDFYVVQQSQRLGTRWIDPSVKSIAFVRAIPQYQGSPGAQKSSGYMVINPFATSSPAGLKSTVAHEFFHILENAHNAFGWRLSDGTHHWFVEAAAKWSEHYFVPDAAARTEQVYPWFKWAFQATDKSLSWAGGGNPYASFVWPLFMQQDSAAGAQSIAAAWRAIEGQQGFTAIQNAINAQLPFDTHFRDFAVRNWNEKLAGDPYTRWQALDGNFPTDQPGAARTGLDQTLQPLSPTGPPLERTVDIPSLRPEYEILSVDERVKKITLDFSGLTPPEATDVDALLKIKDKDWVRRDLPLDEETIFCLDRPDEAVEQFVLVISNHDMRPQERVTGKFTIMSEAAPCGDLVGTLQVTRTGHYASPPGPSPQSYDEELFATISVNVEGDPDPYGGGGFIDAGSVFTVERKWSGERTMGDCTSRYATKSEGSWLFTDRPVGPDWENGIGGFMDREQGFVLLTVVMHYPYEVVEDLCNILPDLDPENAVHDAFACSELFNDAGIEGKITEVEDGPDKVTVNCEYERPGLGYDKVKVTISGTLKLYDEDL